MARPRSTRAESATTPTRRRRIRSSVSHCGAEGARACAHRCVRLNARLRAAILPRDRAARPPPASAPAPKVLQRGDRHEERIRSGRDAQGGAVMTLGATQNV